MFHGPEHGAAAAITEQRAVHHEVLESVRDTKARASEIRRQADAVIDEAHRAERLLEGRVQH